MTLLVHILAGGLGLVLGTVALSARKGGPVHRKSGVLFVCAMLAMCASGLALALLRGAAIPVNTPAAVIAAYLVITGLITIRPPPQGFRWVEPVAMLVALAVGLTSLAFGIEALASPNGTFQGFPAYPYLLFGVVGLLAGVSDLRWIRSGPVRGPVRLVRHLWRMCFALFIGAQAFFLGQSDEFPEALQSPVLLMLPVVAVLLAMGYWIWRARTRRVHRSSVETGRRAVGTGRGEVGTGGGARRG